jgi:hypothetical protein
MASVAIAINLPPSSRSEGRTSAGLSFVDVRPDIG